MPQRLLWWSPGDRSVVWAWMRKRHHLAVLLLFAGVGLYLFSELASELREGELLPFDLTVQRFLRLYHGPFLDRLAYVLSDLPRLPWVLLLLAPFVGWLLHARQYRTAAWLVVLPGATLLVVEVLKLIIGRPRPVTALVEEIGKSFPSGHAAGATVLYGLLVYVACRCWLRRRWARLLAMLTGGLFIIGTGLARVYLEVHYPTDVLAGWSAGAFLLGGCTMILRLSEHPPRPDSPRKARP
jgi:membrane-associated phospholipid phosphatase